MAVLPVPRRCGDDGRTSDHLSSLPSARCGAGSSARADLFAACALNRKSAATRSCGDGPDSPLPLNKPLHSNDFGTACGLPQPSPASRVLAARCLSHVAKREGRAELPAPNRVPSSHRKRDLERKLSLYSSQACRTPPVRGEDRVHLTLRSAAGSLRTSFARTGGQRACDKEARRVHSPSSGTAQS